MFLLQSFTPDSVANLLNGFRLLYSEICSYSVGMGMTRDHVDHTVFVSYIRRYVLTEELKFNSNLFYERVFVSYIRRYVLTMQEILDDIKNLWV